MVRVVLALALAVTAFVVPSFGADMVSLTMGEPETGGITMPNTGDGQYVDAKVEGRTARRPRSDSQPPSHYLYFRTSDDFAGTCKGDLYIVVDYYDSGIGCLALQYQNSGSAYAGGPSDAAVGSKSWQTTVLHVTDAKLGRAQNYGADFRLAISGSAAVGTVRVSTKPVASLPRTPSPAERIADMEKEIVRPSGMEYTFGGDCDEATGVLFRRLGVTSAESYVTWESCEKNGKDQWDWTQWDKQVGDLKKTGLKWVPFLILGPAYSTPNWFRASSDHYPCVCLEHGTKSKIESLWNPNLPKYVDRFIGEFAKRYRDSGVIESVLLGIQGDFGEAIYSVWGGGWTFNIPGEYHNHAGFWCNDAYALADFRKWAAKKYTSVTSLDSAWGTEYASFDQVDFPARGEKEISEFRKSLPTGSGQDRRKWLDFVQWYRDSMTRWSDEWIAITRKYFPKTPIYLCTGGDSRPELGSNFAQQCKVAAKYGAGVRITNEGSDYASNFVVTRWVAAAGRHYGAYFGFEPAGAENEKGVVARIYNATASGALQLHDYSTNIIWNPAAIDAQQKNLKFLKKRDPQVDVALWYPNTAMTIQWGGFFEKAEALRDIIDYDYLDEDMLRDGALKHYKVLVVLHGDFIEQSDLQIVRTWIEGGGTSVVLNLRGIKTVEGDPAVGEALGSDFPETYEVASGTVVDAGLGWDQKDQFFAELVRVLRQKGVPVPDGKTDGVYATTMKDGSALFLNTTEKDVQKTVGSKTVTVKAGTINGE